LLLFFLPFTWGRHRRARATTALPRATSLELLILFDVAHEQSAWPPHPGGQPVFAMKTENRN
jgi:hypothetical protein